MCYAFIMQRGFSLVALIIILALVLSAGVGLYFWEKKNNNLANLGGQKACTLEAKICPDGTGVGRTGPNCEFAACPSVKPSATASSSAEVEEWKTYSNSYLGYKIDYPSKLPPREISSNEQWFGDQISIFVSSKDPTKCKGDCGIITKTDKIEINGIESTRIEGQPPTSMIQYYVKYIIPKGSNFFVLSYGGDQLTQTPTFEKIVRTFKFN